MCAIQVTALSNSRIVWGNNLDVIAGMEDNSIDSVVTDPPYGISFLNKKWDYDVPTVEFWKAVLRVLKPGGHILVFCGTRTQHRMVVNIEDAGFEIRDVITWLYGQGYPKSYNIANGIEGLLTNGSSNTKDYKKLNGTKKSKVGTFGIPTMTHEQGARPRDYSKDGNEFVTDVIYSTEEAKEWDGWGTALKPACEFITLARKPISEKTLVKNVLKWGTGAINIGDCKVELNGEVVPINKLKGWSGFGQFDKPDYTPTKNTKGRWPANLILDDEAGKLLDEQSGISGGKYVPPKARTRKRHFEERGNQAGISKAPDNYGDKGGASRFFYCAKPSEKEKGEFNTHPTVKPIALMEFLVKLITPIKGICLDPFAGSGSTLLACNNLGIKGIGIEREKEYVDITLKRNKSRE